MSRRNLPANTKAPATGVRLDRTKLAAAGKLSAVPPAVDTKSARPSALQHTPSWEHKLAFTLPEVMDIASVSNGYLYKAIGEGRLRAVKRGRRTLVLRADLDAWLNAFPAIQPKHPAA